MTLASGESDVSTGEIEFTLGGVRRINSGSSLYPVYLSVYAASSNDEITIHEGSFISVSFKETTSSLNDSKEEVFVLSRKPNKRLNDDFTWDRFAGKPSLEDNRLSPRSYTNKIRYGGKYIQDQVVNPVSSFNGN